MPRAVGVAIVLMLGLTGCAPEPAASPAASASPTSASSSAPAATPSPTATQAGESADFLSVIDGDTIETSAGTVRIIGIDTPERGECGHNEASAAIGRLLSRGEPVTLVLPPGQNDRDRHGRLLRYVLTADGVDLGLRQVESGHAIARYDSRDGYPAHPNEAAYRAAQIASPGPNGTVIPLGCQGSAPPTTTPSADEPWWQQYPSCAQLKRNTVGHPIGPFDRDDPSEADIYEWFAYGTGNRGDGDGDGLACE